jgi:hypothetical protein
MSCQTRQSVAVRRRLSPRFYVLSLRLLAGPLMRPSAKRRRGATNSPLSSDDEAPPPAPAPARAMRSRRGVSVGGLVHASDDVHTRPQQAMSVAISGTPLQETSCREALPLGPFPSTQQPNITWSHACWRASPGKASVDAECTFKGTRFLHSDQHGAWSFKTSYEHTGPAPELTFHDDWKPSKPNDNHKKVLKVGTSWRVTHRLLTPR